jgi:hypothetical protein
MLRRRGGFLVTGIEPTLVALGGSLDGEALEIACEDARCGGSHRFPPSPRTSIASAATVAPGWRRCSGCSDSSIP